MAILIKEIISFMQNIAPKELAYSWDNVGVMVGDVNQTTEKILLTLDVTESVIEKAIRENIGLIISHHPFIFRSLKNVTDPKIIRLIKNNIVVYSAHTNLDVVTEGVNFALANRLKLTNLQFLQSNIEKEMFQIAVYVPSEYSEQILSTVFKAGAGQIGSYSRCNSRYQVQGSFFPDSKVNPTIGEKESLNLVHEEKLEFVCDSVYLTNVIRSMIQVHPYETPVYYVYKLQQNSQNFGLGYIGNSFENMNPEEFAQFVKEQLSAPFVKLWLPKESKNSMIQRVAVCGGSGGMILNSAREADILVTGDINYHQFLDSVKPIIDAGHFFTENPVLDILEEKLKAFHIQIEKISYENHEYNQLKLI